jgi:hypothetical protein
MPSEQLEPFANGAKEVPFITMVGGHAKRYPADDVNSIREVPVFPSLVLERKFPRGCNNDKWGILKTKKPQKYSSWSGHRRRFLLEETPSYPPILSLGQNGPVSTFQLNICTSTSHTEATCSRTLRSKSGNGAVVLENYPTIVRFSSIQARWPLLGLTPQVTPAQRYRNRRKWRSPRPPKLYLETRVSRGCRDWVRFSSGAAIQIAISHSAVPSSTSNINFEAVPSLLFLRDNDMILCCINAMAASGPRSQRLQVFFAFSRKTWLADSLCLANRCSHWVWR